MAQIQETAQTMMSVHLGIMRRVVAGSIAASLNCGALRGPLPLGML
jgi:hypothetical protein